MYNISCDNKIKNRNKLRGFSSAGRAPALHAGGQEFESPNLQNKKPNDISYSVFYFLRVRFDEKLLMYLLCIRDFEKKYHKFDI